VYVEADAAGHLKTSEGFVRSPGGKRRLSDLKDDEEAEDDEAEGRRPLVMGDHIAYLLPMVKVEDQLGFVVTKIIGFQFSHPCFVKLENGHHTSILASGNVQIARFCADTKRVKFPVRSLDEFKEVE